MPEQPKILIIDDYDLNTKLCRATFHKLKAMVARFLKRPSKGAIGASASGGLEEHVACGDV